MSILKYLNFLVTESMYCRLSTGQPIPTTYTTATSLNTMNKFNPRSLIGDSKKIRKLRRSLGWTQNDAAAQSGYSERLIRKIEAGASVRPTTLRDVLQCYHEALEMPPWSIADFLLDEGVGKSRDFSGSADKQRSSTV